MSTAAFICGSCKVVATMELLDAVEVRVLGALIEKEATTPEYYPLSLNALVSACNQKSNREPVITYDDDTVEEALGRLRDKKLAILNSGSGRVNKFSQRISETLNLGRRELAVLGVLLLRGPQTLGEIKDRCDRMFSFSGLEEVDAVLEKLSDWPGAPLARKLPRQPGQKEARYSHLLAGEPSPDRSEAEDVAQQPPSRLAQLESEITELRLELRDLQRRFDELEAQLR